MQARVLELFTDLREQLGFACLFISRDLAVIDRAAVLGDGAIIESGPTAAVFGSPQHEYTRNLIDAPPLQDPIAQRNRRELVTVR